MLMPSRKPHAGMLLIQTNQSRKAQQVRSKFRLIPVGTDALDYFREMRLQKPQYEYFLLKHIHLLSER